MRLNKEIEIDFINIIAPLSENLKNFKLIGKIENGKFIKITSKGDFGNNNFLDISMKKDENSNKKYLEVYSDLSKPLLTEFIKPPPGEVKKKPLFFFYSNKNETNFNR